MDEFTYNAFANREDPVPVVALDHDISDEAEGEDYPERKRDQIKNKASNLKENFRKKGSDTGSSLQDRMLEK